MRRVQRFVWLWMIAACGGSEAPHDDAGVDTSVQAPIVLELGSGEAAFEAVVDRQRLKLYAGTQGGHHVWLSLRVQGLAPDDVRMTLDVIPSGSARPAHSDVKLDFEPVEGEEGQYEFVGWPAQILDPECAVDSVVSISLTLTDEHGRQASGSMDVIPEPPTLGFTRSCTR